MNITNIHIENFKSIENIDFTIQDSNVLVGPNNSGKTSILQAIWLWNKGKDEILKNKLTFLKSKKQRFGIGINVQQLSAIPVKTVNEIFRNQLVIKDKENKRIKIKLDYDDDIKRGCEIEFYFSNTKDTIRCDLGSACYIGDTVIIENDFENKAKLFDKLEKIKLAYLQPMTAIDKEEEKIENGAIYTKLANGNTAGVLRNLSYKLFANKKEKRELLKNFIQDTFVISLADPIYNESNGTVELYTFANRNKKNQKYELTSLGRGCLQSILLFAFILDSKDSIILLDEPDAHLENFKQKGMYNKITQLCKENGCQLFLATHSESVMNEAIDDNVVGVRGNQTHNLTTTHNQTSFKKILSEYGVDKYYNAEKHKHIIYLEGSTDKKILLEFAKLLGFTDLVDRIENKNDVNIDYAGDNVVGKFNSQFYALKEVVGETLKGLAIYDRDPTKQQEDKQDNPQILFWSRREIESYFFYEYVILGRLTDKIKNSELYSPESLFMNENLLEKIIEDMKRAVKNQTKPTDYEKRNEGSFDQEKVSEYLGAIFSEFLKYNTDYREYIIDKKDYYELVKYIKVEDIDNDISIKLNEINNIIG